MILSGEKKGRFTQRTDNDWVMLNQILWVPWGAELEAESRQNTGQLWEQEEFIQDAPQPHWSFLSLHLPGT